MTTISAFDPRDAKRLFKLPISGLSALAAAHGYLSWSRELSLGLFTNALAVFLLACAASALNEVQEHEIDAQVLRTRNRPVAAGRISPLHATMVALAVGAVGLTLLALTSGRGAAALGLLAVVWYNGVYTPLKRVTAFALLPGALIGSITPAIGWVGAGGPVTDARLLALAFFWFIWQVPHFSLLLMMVGKDYVRGGFRALTELVSPPILTRITYVWVAVTAASALLLPLFGVTVGAWAPFVLTASGAALCWLAWRGVAGTSLRAVFVAINTFALVVMATGIADALV